MNNDNESATVHHSRLIAAVYFALLAIVGAAALEPLLYKLVREYLLPTGEATLLAMLIAGLFGALFGKKIIEAPPPYEKNTFLLGFGMALAALPFYDLGFLILLYAHHPSTFIEVNFREIFVIYFIILAYSFILVGLWLAIAAGLAALYLRSHLIYRLFHLNYSQTIKGPVKHSKPLEHPRTRIIH